MKKRLSILAGLVGIAVVAAYAALEPSAITFTVGFSGTPSASDLRTAKWVIAQENVKRPAGSRLPMSTGAELKASYLLCLSNVVAGFHIESSAKAAEAATTDIPPGKVQEIHAAIVDKLNSGLTPDQIIQLLK